MTRELAECADDLPTIADFKPDLCAALDDRFALSKANAPVRDGDGLRSGDEAVRVISGVAAFCSICSHT